MENMTAEELSRFLAKIKELYEEEECQTRDPDPVLVRAYQKILGK